MRNFWSKKDIISIHAPAKGATFAKLGHTKISKFQSTLPRRERLHRINKITSLINFNPRSREGSDYLQTQWIYGVQRFQSTLPRRERRFPNFTTYRYKNFNPRSREGSDSNIIQQISFSLYNTVYFVSNNIK